MYFSMQCKLTKDLHKKTWEKLEKTGNDQSVMVRKLLFNVLVNVEKLGCCIHYQTTSFQYSFLSKTNLSKTLNLFFSNFQANKHRFHQAAKCNTI